MTLAIDPNAPAIAALHQVGIPVLFNFGADVDLNDLNRHIGYENAAKTAKKAYKENISLKEACVQLGFLTAERFDEVFNPENMA